MPAPPSLPTWAAMVTPSGDPNNSLTTDDATFAEGSVTVPSNGTVKVLIPIPLGDNLFFHLRYVVHSVSPSSGTYVNVTEGVVVRDSEGTLTLGEIIINDVGNDTSTELCVSTTHNTLELRITSEGPDISAGWRWTLSPGTNPPFLIVPPEPS